MNRRDTLLSLLTLSSIAIPLPSFAQESGRIRKIGYLTLEHHELGKGSPKNLSNALKKIGYEEGRNLIIESRWADRSLESLPALAAELVDRKVELIAAFSNAEAIAVRDVTRTIPIVLIWGGSPVEEGLVTSLTHPGGNITGTTYFEPMMLTRSFQFLREAKPSALRIAVVGDHTSNYYREGMEAIAKSAPSLGVRLNYFDVTDTDQVPSMLRKVASSRPDGLFFLQGPPFYHRVSEIASFALEHKLPSIGSTSFWTARGGLLAYHSNPQETIARCASFIDRILRGARPADLPIEMPKRYELTINAKTAKALDLKIPQSLLIQATQVMQ